MCFYRLTLKFGINILKQMLLTKEHIVDSGMEIVYLSPRAREVFKPMEVGEVRTEPFDNMVEQVSVYDKVVDALSAHLLLC